MSLKCPYCNESFEPSEILFYADPTSKEFLKPIDAAQDVTAAPASPVAYRQATDVSRLGGRAERSFSSRNRTDRNPGPSRNSQEQKEPEAKEEQKLGEQCEDLIAKNFLKKYGEGSNFRFSRIATFYAIEPNQEKTPAHGYGWVYTYEDEEHNVPLQLKVPDREEGRQILTKRICPKCHCDIPNGYFCTDQHHVAALAGCSSAGKTQFITVGLRELKEMVARLNLGRMEWALCSEWFYQLYLGIYINTNGKNEATKKVRIFPLMIAITPPNEDKKHFVTFYDCAGEYTTDMDYAANQVGFKMADTIMLMVDCHQLFNEQAEKLLNGELTCWDNYKDAIYPLHDYELSPDLARVVMVITKSDAIINNPQLIHGKTSSDVNDAMLSFDRDLSCHHNAVDLNVIDTIHNELVAMVKNQTQTDIIQEIRDAIKKPSLDIKLSAVSTYAYQGDKLMLDVNQVMGHHRLTEPLLYTLACWNAVRSERKERPVVELPADLETKPRKGLFGWLFGRK